ncbi:MAG TPA: hypothetical protein VIK18_25390 [Pirellulales bacterium]
MAAKTQLTFRIVGKDDGLVEFDDFVVFCDAIQKCLRAVEETAVGHSGRVRYRVVDLQCSSAVIKIEPRAKRDGDAGRRTVERFRETVDALNRGHVDPRMQPDALETFRSLADPLKRHASRVIIGRTTLTEKYVTTISRVLDEVTSCEGSVSGLLERINVHNEKNEFVVYPPVANRQVPCIFHDELLPEVRRAIKRNVTVFGTVFYRPGGTLPSRVHVRSIDIHPSDDELPDLHAVRELGAWDTGGLTSVEFLRALRDE